MSRRKKYVEVRVVGLGIQIHLKTFRSRGRTGWLVFATSMAALLRSNILCGINTRL